MSEYQYYEFLAIDRPLSSAQIKEVQSFSTRATITPTSFTNEYNYGGGFRGSTDEFLTKYFDAMVYVANWGTHQFAFRVPGDLVDIKTIEPYCTDRILNVNPAGKDYIIDICRDEEEGGDWEDGSGYMASLAGLRAEVISGDLRPLFLAWLGDLQAELIESDEPVPPMPPGLKKLTAAQRALVDFLEIDSDLLKMVAAESADAGAVAAFDIDKALARIPLVDKDAWLKELIEADDPHAGMRIKLKLQAAVLPRQSPVAGESNQTAGELLEKYKKQEQELEERRRQKKQAEREIAAKAAAKAREFQLDQLERDIPGAWRKIDQLIALRNPEVYKQAVELMKDLRDVSNRSGGNVAGFKNHLETRLAEHARKPNLIKMMERAGLR